MCGISGIWSNIQRRTEELQDSVNKMTSQLLHRGPDDRGMWCDPAEGIALGHTRLSIIDLSRAARQPMVGPGGQTRIVFNGEIYNYLELRKSLITDGAVFRTASDTEVILALYERYGLDCLRFLRGMFAFAIWDVQNQKLVIARDRLGKKPIYYSSLPGGFFFASEIKALRLIAKQSQLDIDHLALDQYLSYGFISGPRTIYSGIQHLPPGAVLVATDPDHIAIDSYWKPSHSEKKPISFSRAVKEVDQLITTAVQLRLRADVPVGIFLSGGIDSGIVTAIASKYMDTACPTFTVGFEDSNLDERPLAGMVAKKYGTHHSEMVLQPNITDLLPKIVKAYAQPFADASAIPSFCMAEFVRKNGIKVVLNGDGGDELFGGYRRALATSWLSKIMHITGENAITRFAKMLNSILPNPRTHRGLYPFGHRFIRGIAAGGTNRMLIWSSDGFSNDEKKALRFNSEGNNMIFSNLKSYIPSDNGLSLLDRTICLDLQWMLPYALLVKMDIATMSHGLEARSPFLDHELVEWSLSLPDDIRLPGFKTKPVLRELAKKYLPEKVCNAPKKGFEPPLYRWLTQDLKEMRDDLLLSRNGLVAMLFDRSRIEQFLSNTSGDHVRWATLVWTLLMLAAWDYYAVEEDNRFLNENCTCH